MGFYNTHTPEGKLIKQLTGEVQLSKAFKKELELRNIPVSKGYNIQKRLMNEVERGTLKANGIEDRLMELLDENSKKTIKSNYVEEIAEKTPKSMASIPPRPYQAPVKNELNNSAYFLKEITKQNEIIIKQNKTIIEELKKLNKRD